MNEKDAVAEAETIVRRCPVTLPTPFQASQYAKRELEPWQKRAIDEIWSRVGLPPIPGKKE